ncbi:MAG TPA: tRNA (adenosine(37)-N6)-dimethylallyltransferase MiaA [Caulobacteraceae bacterium]|jgi:tRNA dimethylallyltransferase
MTAPPVWLIAGPTASGKSAAALALARETGGEIVNADSMQLYAGLRILTARPTPEDEAAAPHHLFGVADAGEAWSVGRWLAAALDAVAGIAARGRPAIVVGGTGLYFRALTHGLADIPPVPAAVRASVQADYERLGEAGCRERLAAVDPAAEARIASGDRQRLSRALEVFVASGRSLSDWREETRPTLPPDAWSGVVLTLPRAELYARIDARLEAMIATGALAEVEALLARRLDPALPAMKALGVAALAEALAGDLTPVEALAHAQAETRRYAKRQITWFDRQNPGWPRLSAHQGVAALQQTFLRKV